MKSKKQPYLKEIPALIIGSGITALGVIRSLAQKGIETYYITSNKDFVRYNRWSKPIYRELSDFPNTDELSKLLNGIDIDKAVLFPCSDNYLQALIMLPDKLKSRFYFSLPKLEVVETLIDKYKFSLILRKNKIPHPESILIRDKRHLLEYKEKIERNYFLKPCNSRKFNSLFNVKAFNIKNINDAQKKFDKAIQAGTNIMLQEYIPGSSNLHYFVDGFIDKKNDIKSLFARQRIRIYPPDFGNSSFCKSITLNEVSETKNYLTRLFKDIGYQGIFSAEFKFDLRDNQFKILEINARPWWYVGFATHCGINTCIQAYADALGENVENIENYKVGIGCIHSRNDFLTSIDLIRNGKLSLFSWIKDFLKANKPVFAWDDPLPSIVLFWQRLINFYEKI